MKGLQVTPTGFRMFVRVKGFPLQSKRFPTGTTPAVMAAWREHTHARLVLTRDERDAAIPPAGSFANDAARYLNAVAALPSIAERQRQIAVWVKAFGPRPRADIRRDEIAALRDQWALHGPRLVQRSVHGTRVFVEVDRPLSPSAINHRLRALSNLWTVLDGRRAMNPVRDVAELDEPEPQPRAIAYATIRRVLARIRDGKSKARLSVMAYCGIRPAQLMKLSPAAVDLRGRAVTLPRSQKGKRFHRTPTKALTTEGVRAFQLMRREDAWGSYSQASLGRTWRRACRALGLTGLRAYDLRHSFGTRLYLQTKNLSLVAEFLDHGDLRTTERYTLAAKHTLMHQAARQW